VKQGLVEINYTNKIIFLAEKEEKKGCGWGQHECSQPEYCPSLPARVTFRKEV